MFFTRRSGSEIKRRLLDCKRLKICGMRFTIKRINPLIDFPVDRIPQIFTDYMSRRKGEVPPTASDLAKMQQETYAVIEAAVIEPILVPIGQGEAHGRENGITVEDLFRDPEIGFKLYSEIINHSLLRFRGLKGLFFSIKAKYLAYIQWRKSLGKHP